MILAVIGAGSPRTPLLIRGLLSRNMKLEHLYLYDKKQQKLELNARVIEAIIAASGQGLKLTIASSYQEAVEQADFVFSSIRVGGDESRIADETTALKFGQLPQETVGIGGFSMAYRTIPVVVEQANILHRINPKAWIINFTNPSGMITQAILENSNHKKVIGICDAPIMIDKFVGTLYGVSKDHITTHYTGLNHLGWVTSVKVDGKGVMEELVHERLKEFVEQEPFYQDLVDHIQTYHILPNEYLYYYLYHETIAKKMAGVKQTRGQVIHTLNKQYYEALSVPGTNPIDVYNHYIQQRDGSYMTQETGYARKEAPRFDILTHTGLWGYDAVAFNLVEALVDTNQGKQLIVNVANRGTLPYLTDSDVIETSCLCKNGQCHATETTTELPACATDLIKQVKKFERLTIAAAGKRDRESQIAALEENPVVAKHLVPQIIDDLNKRFASIGSDDE